MRNIHSCPRVLRRAALAAAITSFALGVSAAEPAERPEDHLKTCEELYNEITTLIPASHSTRPEFFRDPPNRAIAAVGVFAPEAYYLWGVTSVQRYVEERQFQKVQARITALRRLSADRLCFIK